MNLLDGAFMKPFPNVTRFLNTIYALPQARAHTHMPHTRAAHTGHTHVPRTHAAHTHAAAPFAHAAAPSAHVLRPSPACPPARAGCRAVPTHAS